LESSQDEVGRLNTKVVELRAFITKLKKKTTNC